MVRNCSYISRKKNRFRKARKVEKMKINTANVNIKTKKKNMGIGNTIGSVGGSLLGMIGQNSRAKKQHNRQKELMGIQMGNQKSLNKQGHQLQMDMWNKTNYGAQKDHMLEAGLNPALMYGMSGGGGTTTGSQGGGSAQGGNAHAPMDIGNAIQLGLMKAQTDNIIADTTNKKAQTTTETQRAGLTLNQAVLEAGKIWEKARENKIGDATAESEIKGILAENIGKEIDNELKKINKTLNETQIKELENRIIQNWIKTGAQSVEALTGSVGKMVNAFIGKQTKSKK